MCVLKVYSYQIERHKRSHSLHVVEGYCFEDSNHNVLHLCSHMSVKTLELNVYTGLYPTYDVDQSTASVYICGIVLWLGKYHDIALWYN